MSLDLGHCASQSQVVCIMETFWILSSEICESLLNRKDDACLSWHLVMKISFSLLQITLLRLKYLVSFLQPCVFLPHCGLPSTDNDDLLFLRNL